MTIRFFTLAALTALFAFPAFALDLHQARNAGMVGEKSDGYITALKPSPDVSALVSDVNTKRQQEYQRISQQNRQPVDVVAKLAAMQIIGKLDAGNQYQGADGSWKTR